MGTQSTSIVHVVVHCSEVPQPLLLESSNAIITILIHCRASITVALKASMVEVLHTSLVKEQSYPLLQQTIASLLP